MYGASFDTAEENRAFRDSERFNFSLLSDVDRAVGRQYEVARADDDQWAALPMRIAYLIDPDGVIRRAYEVKDTAGHADAVIADLEQLQG